MNIFFTKMEFTLLKLIFTIGNILTVTPSSIDVEPSQTKTKIRVFAMLTFYTAAVFTSFYFRTPSYMQYIHIKLAIKVMVDSSLFLFTITTVIFSVTKRPQWFFLIRNLRLTQYEKKSSPKLPVLGFLVCNALFWAIIIFMSYVFTRTKFWSFYRSYAIEYPQLYVQFLMSSLFCSVTAMLKCRYYYLHRVLSRQISLIRKENKHSLKKTFSLIFLDRIKYDLNILKEATDYFNSIFGWPFLLTLIFSSLQVLSYLDSLFSISSRKKPLNVLSNVLMTLLLVVSILARHNLNLFGGCSSRLQSLYGCAIWFFVTPNTF